MFTTSICLFLAVTLVKGQIPSLGYCPDYLPINEFDINKFLGKWYEAERYFTLTEVASRCVVTDYAKANSGRIYVSNEVTNRLTGVKRIINGNLQLIGKGDLGKLNVKYATTPIPTESTLTVLDTDYDNFAVVWSCTGFGPFHAQNAWLMTRDRLPTGSILQKAYGVLDKFKISRTFFVKTDQEGCALAASDINAANGITSTSTIQQATGTDQRDGIVEIKSAGLVDLDMDQSVLEKLGEIRDIAITKEKLDVTVRNVNKGNKKSKEDVRKDETKIGEVKTEVVDGKSGNLKSLGIMDDSKNKIVEKNNLGQTESAGEVDLEKINGTVAKSEEKKSEITEEKKEDNKEKNIEDMKEEKIVKEAVEKVSEKQLEKGEEMKIEKEKAEEKGNENNNEKRDENAEEKKQETKEEKMEEMKDEKKEKMKEEIKDEKKEEMKEEKKEEMMDEKKEEMKEEKKEEMKNKNKEEMKEEKMEEMKDEKKEETEEEKTEEIKDEKREEMKDEKREEMKDEKMEEMKVGEKAAMKDEMKEAKKEELKVEQKMGQMQELKVEQKEEEKTDKMGEKKEQRETVDIKIKTEGVQNVSKTEEKEDENKEINKEDCVDKVENKDVKIKEYFVKKSENKEEQQSNNIDKKEVVEKMENIVKTEEKPEDLKVETLPATNNFLEKKESLEKKEFNKKDYIKKPINPDKFKLILEKQNLVLKGYDKVPTLETFKATEKQTQNKEVTENFDVSSSSEESSEEKKPEENTDVETEKKVVSVAEHILKIKSRNNANL